MTLPKTDSFTGTNGISLTAYSACWVLVNGSASLLIKNNAVTANAGGTETVYRWTGDTFNNDQSSQITVAAAASGDYMGAAVRCDTGAASHKGSYSIEADSKDASYLFVWSASGLGTQLGSTGATSASNDTLKITAVGTTITPYKNGSNTGMTAAQTDSTWSSGTAGVLGYGTDQVGLLDSFIGDNVSGAAATVATGFLQPMGIFH